MDTLPLSTARTWIRDQVGHHPLIAFVLLAYAISWTAWLLANRFDFGASNGFSVIGSAGPALAAFIVSAILQPISSGGFSQKHLRLFGLVSILILALFAARRLWLAQAYVAVVGRPARPLMYPGPFAVGADILSAATLSFFFSGIRSSTQGMRSFLGSLDPGYRPIRWAWLIVAGTLYPLIVVVGNLISIGAGIPLPPPQVTGPGHWIALDAILMFLLVLIGGGGLEEPGWRGLALPLLQERYKPLPSSLILAVVWAFWHWPLFWWGYSEGGPLGILPFVVGAIPLSILFTAIYNRSGGSLLVVMLLHTAYNITGTYLRPSGLATGLWTLMILAVAVWMWRCPQAFSRTRITAHGPRANMLHS